jgi:hypothetical protein
MNTTYLASLGNFHGERVAITRTDKENNSVVNTFGNVPDRGDMISWFSLKGGGTCTVYQTAHPKKILVVLDGPWGVDYFLCGNTMASKKN